MSDTPNGPFLFLVNEPHRPYPRFLADALDANSWDGAHPKAFYAQITRVVQTLYGPAETRFTPMTIPEIAVQARSLISGHDLAKLRLDIAYALARSVTPHQED